MADVKTNSERKDVLAQDITCLFYKSQYSDFTIKSEARSWKVHKAIICQRSEYFEKVCAGQFKESSDSCITLQDDSPDVVNSLLQFLYSADYDVDAHDDEEGTPMSFHVHVYAIADKYQLADLASLALTKFSAAAEPHFEHAGFAHAVEVAYSTAPSSKSALRMTIVDIIRRHSKELMLSDAGKKLREVISTVPELGLELCVGMAMNPMQPVTIPDNLYTCCSTETCGKVMRFSGPLVGTTNYVCPHCNRTSHGKSLISRREAAVVLLKEMHAARMS